MKENQKHINSLKEKLKSRKVTIKTYENLLNNPVKSATTEVFRCVLCFKYFMNNDYLSSHYKKRHRDYYEQELREKENQQLMNNL